MKLLIRVIALGLVSLWLAASAGAVETRDPYKFFFNETWGNFQEELENARSQGKSAVLIFFEMDECPYCHYMKLNVLNRPNVQDYYRQHFLTFAVDIEGDVEITNFKGQSKRQKDFAFRENRVRATPVFAFFDLEGNRIYRHIGKTRDADEFLLIGDYIVNGIYKEMSFTRYKRAKSKAASN
jgi:thioredoxin-related protein